MAQLLVPPVLIALDVIGADLEDQPGDRPAGVAQAPFKIISRGDAAGTYQAFTDLRRVANGDLLCVFYGGYGHVSLPREDCPRGGRICVVRSRDEGPTAYGGIIRSTNGGRTWGAPIPIDKGSGVRLDAETDFLPWD